MRRIDMKRLPRTLTVIPLLATSVLLAGCASSSGSDASAGSSAQPSASATWTGTSEHPGSPTATTSASGAPASAPVTSSPVTSSPVTSSAPSAAGPSDTETSPRIPASATSAQLTYLGPKMAKPVRVEKTVTGATFKRLAEDLDALKPQPGGVAECMVLTGENATVTITAAGHTWVFTIDGSPCRGVNLSKDGAQQPKLTNSMTLLNQIRAIAGYTGMAHPLTG